MRPYCEAVVKHLLPAIRSALAKELLEAGMTQEKIAETLHISQPAVSHYVRKARGKDVGVLKANRKVRNALKFAAEAIKAGKSMELCQLCREIKATGILCELECQPGPCNACFEMI